MPRELQRFIDEWKRLHPGWTFHLWDSASLPTLRNQDMFDSPAEWSPKSNVWQWRSDLARYEILHTLGGVYVDCDLEPLRAIDDLLDDAGFIAREDDTFLNNAILGCEPGSPWMDDIISGARRSAANNWRSRVNKQIGAHYITKVTARHSNVRVYPSSLFYPAHWRDAANVSAIPCGEAYTRHHWWNKQTELGLR